MQNKKKNIQVKRLCWTLVRRNLLKDSASIS
jgi:hypothetical protein